MTESKAKGKVIKLRKPYIIAISGAKEEVFFKRLQEINNKDGSLEG